MPYIRACLQHCLVIKYLHINIDKYSFLFNLRLNLIIISYKADRQSVNKEAFCLINVSADEYIISDLYAN